MKKMTDEALMARYQAGDLSAFNLLHVRYEKRIYNYFLKHIGDPERAAELFQETFMKLHRDRHRYDSERPFFSWIFTIASNTAKNELKRIGRSRKFFGEGDVDYETVKDLHGRGGEEDIEKKEQADRVKRALRSLPDGQREVIILSKYEGLRYAEIARITGGSVGGVKQKIHRGMMTLRKLLSGEGEVS